MPAYCPSPSRARERVFSVSAFSVSVSITPLSRGPVRGFFSAPPREASLPRARARGQREGVWHGPYKNEQRAKVLTLGPPSYPCQKRFPPNRSDLTSVRRLAPPVFRLPQQRQDRRRLLIRHAQQGDAGVDEHLLLIELGRRNREVRVADQARRLAQPRLRRL